MKLKRCLVRFANSNGSSDRAGKFRQFLVRETETVIFLKVVGENNPFDILNILFTALRIEVKPIGKNQRVVGKSAKLSELVIGIQAVQGQMIGPVRIKKTLIRLDLMGFSFFTP